MYTINVAIGNKSGILCYTLTQLKALYISSKLRAFGVQDRSSFSTFIEEITEKSSQFLIFCKHPCILYVWQVKTKSAQHSFFFFYQVKSSLHFWNAERIFFFGIGAASKLLLRKYRKQLLNSHFFAKEYVFNFCGNRYTLTQLKALPISRKLRVFCVQKMELLLNFY